jgi:Protein of unknown function (DUF3987)/Bifunctional DNA primase/polymerase, N-terminal
MSDFDPEFASVAAYAREYRRNGLQAVPALSPAPGIQWKRPAIKWREHETTLADQATFDRWFARHNSGNIGYLTGESSGRVFTCDYDTQKGPEADQWWQGLLAVHNNGMDIETPTLRTGGGGIQRIFRYPPHWRPPTCKTPIHIDIRGIGGFAVLPPSLHESGKHYEWLPGLAPWEVEIAMAPQWLMDAIDALGAKYGGKAPGSLTDGHQPLVRTQTPNVPTTLSGKLLDGREEYMARVVWAAVVDLRADSPIRVGDFAAECEEVYQRYADHVASRLGASLPRDEALEREGRGRSLFREKWIYALGQWDGAVKEAVAAREVQPRKVEVEYIDPKTGEVLDDLPEDKTTAQEVRISHTVFDPWDQSPVPDFPLDVLPFKVADFIRVTAKSTGGDINAVAMTALVSCATAIDQSYRLKMKRTGTWRVPPRLWVMLVGDPSSKKTPIIQNCLAPIIGIERELDRAYLAEYARWKKAHEDGDPEPEKPRRFTANSITIEKVAEILSRQGSGITVINDELGGWIGTLDGSKGRGGEADKGFWAEAYNGGRYRTDRIGRGEAVVENLCCNFIGGLQPSMMERLGALNDNGLLQRFLPVMMRQGDVSADVDDLALSFWETLLARLSSYAGCTMTASPAGMEVFTGFERRCNELQRMTSLGAQFCTFVGKLMGLQGSLALILHLIDNGWDSPVSEGSAEAATRILEEFVIPHALAFYRSSSDQTNWESIRNVASYVITSDKDRFTPSDFMAHVRSMRGLSAWEIGQRVAPLVAAGWLDEDRPKGAALRGWVMVDGVRDVLSERREEQIRRRREAFEIVSTMGRRRVKNSSKI